MRALLLFILTFPTLGNAQEFTVTRIDSVFPKQETFWLAALLSAYPKHVIHNRNNKFSNVYGFHYLDTAMFDTARNRTGMAAFNSNARLGFVLFNFHPTNERYEFGNLFVDPKPVKDYLRSKHVSGKIWDVVSKCVTGLALKDKEKGIIYFIRVSKDGYTWPASHQICDELDGFETYQSILSNTLEDVYIFDMNLCLKAVLTPFQDSMTVVSFGEKVKSCAYPVSFTSFINMELPAMVQIGLDCQQHGKEVKRFRFPKKPMRTLKADIIAGK